MTQRVMGLVVVLALAAAGCSETSGVGGTSGDGGDGGHAAGGDAGDAGSGGEGGSGPTCDPMECDDGDLCTFDYCSSPGCFHQARACDDGSECTSDLPCDPTLGCVAEALENGTPCAGGTCQDGECALTTTHLPCTEAGVLNALRVGGGPYTFDCSEGDSVAVRWAPSIPGNVGYWTVDQSVELDGEGTLTLTSLPLAVSRNAAVTLRRIDSRFDDGFYGDWFLRNDGILNLVSVHAALHGNPKLRQAPNTGILNVTDSTLLGISPIYNLSGDVVVRRSTLDGSVPIVSCPGSTTAIVNSTVSPYGDGVELFGTVTIVNSTFAPWSLSGFYYLLPLAISPNIGGADPGCSNIDSTSSTTRTIRGSILAGIDCTNFEELTFTSAGYNVQSPGDDCGLDQPTDQVDVSTDDLKLGELADNGGPTETHALGARSIALNFIPQAECVDADGEPLTVDQRGEPRDSMCDVGAFEDGADP